MKSNTISVICMFTILVACKVTIGAFPERYKPGCTIGCDVTGVLRMYSVFLSIRYNQYIRIVAAGDHSTFPVNDPR